MDPIDAEVCKDEELEDVEGLLENTLVGRQIHAIC